MICIKFIETAYHSTHFDVFGGLNINEINYRREKAAETCEYLLI